MSRLTFNPLLVLILLMLASESIAQDKRGFAVSVGFGGSRISDIDGAQRFDGNAFGYGIGVEYRFNNHFAFGTNIFNLGTAEDDFDGVSTEIEVKAFDLEMRFVWPVSDGFELFGLIGQAGYTADLEPGGNNGPFGDDATVFGLGFDVGSGKFAFRVAGRYFDGSKDESGALVTAGFNYRF